MSTQNSIILIHLIENSSPNIYSKITGLHFFFSGRLPREPISFSSLTNKPSELDDHEKDNWEPALINLFKLGIIKYH